MKENRVPALPLISRPEKLLAAAYQSPSSALVPHPPALALCLEQSDFLKTCLALHACRTGWLMGKQAPHHLMQGLLPAKPCLPKLGLPQTGPERLLPQRKVTPLFPTPVSEQLDFSGYMCATI